MTLTPELPGTDVVTGRWLTDHSWNRPSWTVAELEAAKAGRTISVVLPALNEEDTVGSVVELARITATPVPTIEAIYRTTALLARTILAT